MELYSPVKSGTAGSGISVCHNMYHGTRKNEKILKTSSHDQAWQ